MVGKRKKQRRKSPALLGNHQRCWLWGRHVVLETLRAGRWLPLEVVYDPDALDPVILNEVQALLGQLKVPSREVPASDLRSLCGSGEHQGLLAKMPPYPYVDVDDALSFLPPTGAVLVLAGIQDPFNFGSILRSADLFSFDAVFIPEQEQVPVSSHVARSSVGAVNYLRIARCPDLVKICGQLKSRGLKLLAATEKGDRRPDQIDLTTGCTWIIGNEGTGIPVSLLELCDQQVAIPQQGHVGSLNAAVAAGILCYELRRQRETS